MTSHDDSTINLLLGIIIIIIIIITIIDFSNKFYEVQSRKSYIVPDDITHHTHRPHVSTCIYRTYGMVALNRVIIVDYMSNNNQSELTANYLTNNISSHCHYTLLLLLKKGLYS